MDNPIVFQPCCYPREGNFRVSGIPAGNYRVFALPQRNEPIPQARPEFISQYESRALSVTVQKGITSGNPQVPFSISRYLNSEAVPRSPKIKNASPEGDAILTETSNRGERIRTSGLLRPRQARYQAAPRPDLQETHCASFAIELQ